MIALYNRAPINEYADWSSNLQASYDLDELGKTYRIRPDHSYEYKSRKNVESFLEMLLDVTDSPELLYSLACSLGCDIVIRQQMLDDISFFKWLDALGE